MITSQNGKLNISNTSNLSNSFSNCKFILSSFKEYSSSVEASDISIKMVLNGIENYKLNGKSYKIDNSKFLIVNRQSKINLTINDSQDVKGICLYPSEELINDAYKSHLFSQAKLLDKPFDKTEEFHLLEKAFGYKQSRIGKYLSNNIHSILIKYKNQEAIDFESFYIKIVECLIQDQLEIEGKLSGLTSIRKTTKEELFRRVSSTKDFIEDNYTQKINLNELAENAYLSKYHFSRSFKAIYQVSPYQYLLKLRIDKAQELLKKEYTISQINDIVGFSDERNLRKALFKAS